MLYNRWFASLVIFHESWCVTLEHEHATQFVSFPCIILFAMHESYTCIMIPYSFNYFLSFWWNYNYLTFNMVPSVPTYIALTLLCHLLSCIFDKMQCTQDHQFNLLSFHNHDNSFVTFYIKKCTLDIYYCNIPSSFPLMAAVEKIDSNITIGDDSLYTLSFLPSAHDQTLKASSCFLVRNISDDNVFCFSPLLALVYLLAQINTGSCFNASFVAVTPFC